MNFVEIQAYLFLHIVIDQCVGQKLKPENHEKQSTEDHGYLH